MVVPVFQWEIDVVASVASYRENPMFLSFMELVSDFSRTWFIVAAAILIVAYRHGVKWTLLRVAIISLAVIVADIVARYAVKAIIQRPRPTHLNLECITSDCWGFVSNHAANTFAAATILILLNRKNAAWAIPVTLLVGLSRIVLGKHFPLDVIGGYFIGLSVAILVALALIPRIKNLREIS